MYSEFEVMVGKVPLENPVVAAPNLPLRSTSSCSCCSWPIAVNFSAPFPAGTVTCSDRTALVQSLECTLPDSTATLGMRSSARLCRMQPWQSPIFHSAHAGFPLTGFQVEIVNGPSSWALAYLHVCMYLAIHACFRQCDLRPPVESVG